MADKRDSQGSNIPFDAFELIIILILIVGGAGGVIAWASHYKDTLASFLKTMPFYLINIFAKYTVFALFLSIVLIILIVIYRVRENKIRKKIMSKIIPVGGEVETNSEISIVENPKWKLVLEHINSEDANKWKLAILEADIILSELLDNLHLPGEGVGEKLKSVEESDFGHIEEAWEAHKIRNAIAHQGSDFLLTQKEAKRVIKLYESVFEEFEII
jgi:hypothetical protein